MKLFFGEPGSGKTSSLIEWAEAAPDGIARVCVFVDRDETMDKLRAYRGGVRYPNQVQPLQSILLAKLSFLVLLALILLWTNDTIMMVSSNTLVPQVIPAPATAAALPLM